MKFEPFADTEEVGKKSLDEMSRIVVSEASRSDAHAKPVLKYDSYEDEYNELCRKKKQLEDQLSLYNGMAFQKARFAIKQDAGGRETPGTYRRWMLKKTEMETARQGILKVKLRVEDRLIELRKFVKAEKFNKSEPLAPILLDILAELRALRKDLQTGKD